MLIEDDNSKVLLQSLGGKPAEAAKTNDSDFHPFHPS
jgi:hypothetical protein